MILIVRKFIVNTAGARLRAAQAVMAITSADKYEVIIQPNKENQTSEQRGFFHALLKIMADELGYSPDAMKQCIKAECWGVETVTIGELTVDVIKSSAGAKKDEYSELIEVAYRISAEYGIVLPNARWNGP